MDAAREAEHYKAIIIGAGQAGNPLSRALPRAGWKTALIERQHVGGTCINVGCTPTKTMIASARVAHLAARGADYGVHTSPPAVNLAEVVARRRGVVLEMRGSNERSIERTKNLDFLRGEARFVGPKAVEVAMSDGSTRRLSGDYVFLNTGCRPAIPDLDGLDTVPYLNSNSILDLEIIPEHLIVLGGGYIGLEYAQMFRRFGSRVTIVHRSPRVLSSEDADVSDEIARILQQDDIELVLDSMATRVRYEEGSIHLTVKTPFGQRRVTGSHLLVAVGRVPNTESLNLAAAGIKTDRNGYITVNDRLETSAEGVYALGDVNGGPAFTHVSYDDFRVIRANLVDGGTANTQRNGVPYTVFLDPQLGRIGLTEAQARKQKKKVKVATMPMGHVARAIESAETRGFMKAVVDADSGQILGCAILGMEGGELMAMIQIAMMGNLHYTALRDAVFAHPTLAESFNNLFSKIE